MSTLGSLPVEAREIPLRIFQGETRAALTRSTAQKPGGVTNDLRLSLRHITVFTETKCSDKKLLRMLLVQSWTAVVAVVIEQHLHACEQITNRSAVGVEYRVRLGSELIHLTARTQLTASLQHADHVTTQPVIGR